jgi:uncharacterized protein (DUF885 family)
MAPSRTSARAVADAYVDTLTDLDPLLAEQLGVRPGADAMPDFSPDGLAAVAAAQRAALADLAAVEAAAPPGGLPHADRRAARLLRERLTAQLALDDAGENLRNLDGLFSPAQQIRGILLLMPTATDDDWAAVARRLRNVPAAVAGYRATLAEGIARGLTTAPRQARTVVEQLDAWLAADWFRAFAAGGPEPAAGDLARAATTATEAVAGLRDFLRETYLPATAATPDAVGRDRYLLGARRWTGADLDPEEAYAFGWAEFRRLAGEMAETARHVLPGATAAEAMRHLEKDGPAADGEEDVRRRLQELVDRAVDALDGVHFDIAPPIRRIETVIAPPGSAAAPYYTRPSLDFSRPGRTWLPTQGMTRFPMWHLVSTWYHEGVPGHHLQLAQWVLEQDRLSRFQATVGSVSATTEGWALYAERLMDELGFLADPGHRLGYLSGQMLRAVRVIIDIGLHLGLRVPDDEAFHPGEVWVPDLAAAFFARHTGHDPAYTRSEITRYLGRPGQAIAYKLGERAWLAGRDAARAAAGPAFDLKAWHMAALSLGSLGLDDLAGELAAAGAR